MEEPALETLSLIFPLVVAGLIVPIVAWLKAKLPTDLPIRAPMIALVFSGGAMWGLAEWLAPGMSRDALIQYTLGTQVVTQLIDSFAGTVKKIKNGG